VGVEQNLALHFEFRKDEKPKNKGFSRIFCQNRLLTVEDRSNGARVSARFRSKTAGFLGVTS
jgi:hypothetical protein